MKPLPAEDLDKTSTLFEPEPEHDLEPGIDVTGLGKSFKSFGSKEVIAVDSVTFKAFHGEITALLGHNGAGKTTTMSVLTGMISPSQGSAKINGYNITNEMHLVRQNLGLCPQHNMSFSDLTVLEHLLFFGSLKGLSMKEANVQAASLITQLGLEPKKDLKVDTLSGGMKRKLQLGIALIGDSKVVLLDEPTSGMDPEARRQMWDLLQSLKKDRTILLTTHFMEEADVLGDRVVIMGHGKVLCNGSPLYLKRLLGEGYTLTMTRGPNCDSKGASALIKGVIKGAALRVTKTELIFSMPGTEMEKFPELFEALDEAKAGLDVFNIGLKATTMEDVFLKVGSMSDNDTPEEKEEDQVTLISQNTIISEAGPQNFSGYSNQMTGLALYFYQFWGLFIKRMIYTKRRFILYTIMALVPVAMGVLVQYSVNASGDAQTEFPALPISINTYDSESIFYYHDTTGKGLNDSYNKVVGSQGQNVDSSINFKTFIIDKGEEGIPVYRSYMIGTGNFLMTDYVMVPNLTAGSDPKEMIRNKRSIEPEPDFMYTSLEYAMEPLTIYDMIEVKSMANSVPLHSRPIALNLINNALLKHLDTDGAGYTISFTNHPLPDNSLEDFQATSESDFLNPDSFFYSLSLGTGISFFVAVFMIFPLTERITNAKQVQLMTGVSPLIFWKANLVWDAILMIASSLLTVALVVATDSKYVFSSNGALGTFLLLLIMHGISAIPLAYIISFFANTPATGFARLIVLNLLTGGIAPIAVYIMRLIGESDLDSTKWETISDWVRYPCSFVPSFPLGRSLIALVQIQNVNNRCLNGVKPEFLIQVCTELVTSISTSTEIDPVYLTYAECCSSKYVASDIALCDLSVNIPCHNITSLYTWNKLVGINIDLIWMACTFLFYIVILMLLELKVFARLWAKIHKAKKGAQTTESILDSDVDTEKKRIKEIIDNGQNLEDHVLLVNELCKQFNKNMIAVNDLSFGVKIGQCFGLLGVNGAGKTTTFKMLTGDETLTDGSTYLLGTRLDHSKRRKFLSMIGYCPQFDSIIDMLTGREMLNLFARLRGMRPADISKEVDRLIEEVGIQEYADRKCGTYSGGNKRKLNVAQALVADPPIVFLDEPSSGVDPASRRVLWTIIKAVQKKGQSIILTSHSMDECEELCDPIGIMVNGQFQCYGSAKHLKSKFGQGFTILVKLDTNGMTKEKSQIAMSDFKQHIMTQFQGCLIKDEHKDYVHLHVTDPNTPWAYMFSTMEEAKKIFQTISDYSVSETTLEQVFLSFAKNQRLENLPDTNNQE